MKFHKVEFPLRFIPLLNMTCMFLNLSGSGNGFLCRKGSGVSHQLDNWGHGGRVVRLSPPTSEVGVRSPHGLKWESW